MLITKTPQELKELYTGLSMAAKENNSINQKIFSIGVWFVFDRHTKKEEKLGINQLIEGLFTEDGNDLLIKYIEANSELINPIEEDDLNLVFDAILSMNYLINEAYIIDKDDIRYSIMDLGLGMMNAYGYLIETEEYKRLLEKTVSHLNAFRSMMLLKSNSEGRSDN